MSTSNKNPGRSSRASRRRNARPNNQISAAPVATSNLQTFPRSKRQNSYSISNSELVDSVAGSNSGVLLVRRYAINPGLSDSFPYLAAIAARWQQYRFKRLMYRFVTRSPTSTPGSVILSPEYDPNESPPSAESSATNTMGAVEDVAWKNLSCQLDISAMFPLGPRKYVRHGPMLFGDRLAYDSGEMRVCTINNETVNAVGKLWVDYEIEFFVPQTETITSYIPTRSVGGLLREYSVTASGGAFVSGPMEFDVQVSGLSDVPAHPGIWQSAFGLPKGIYWGIFSGSVSLSGSGYVTNCVPFISVDGDVTKCQGARFSNYDAANGPQAPFTVQSWFIVDEDATNIAFGVTGNTNLGTVFFNDGPSTNISARWYITAI
jgi:hypothetical protein